MCVGGGGGGRREIERAGALKTRLIHISPSKWDLICQGVMIPVWGESFVAILAVKHGYESAVFHPLSQRFPLRLFWSANHTPRFIGVNCVLL